MKQKQLVCNLKLSKKLKELKVKQDSNLYWDLHAIEKINGIYGLSSDGDYSAFTTGELGIILNRIFKNNPLMDISDKEYIELVGKAFRFEDEANVRAKMLIHLIIKEFIKL